MTKLILADAVICAASEEVFEEPWGYRTSDGHFPYVSGVTGVVEVELPAGFRPADWRWEDGGLVYAPQPVPPELVVIPPMVSMRQARLALLQAGRLADVDAAIAALPSPAKEAAQIEWEYAIEVKRDSQLVTQLAPALGLDDAALDALFIAAAAL
jgi:hypothetical protein